MRIRRDIPSFLQSLHTDEFPARPPSDDVVQVARRATEIARPASRGDDEGFWVGRQGTAAGLIAMNEQFGNEYFAVPRACADDPEAADEVLGGDEVVIDVQTHYVADRDQSTAPHLIEMYRYAMPAWWRGLDGYEAYSFGEYLRCVFVETETAVAVLSSSPGVEDHRQLYNEELSATRRLLDEFGGRQRLLNHTVVDPNASRRHRADGPVGRRVRPGGVEGVHARRGEHRPECLRTGHDLA